MTGRRLRDLGKSTYEGNTGLADWVEISTLFQADRSVSREDLVRALIRGDDSTPEGDEAPRTTDGARERLRRAASDAFDELAARARAIPGGTAQACYPFEIDERDLLRLRNDDPTEVQPASVLYLFLLAITRASMDSRHRTLGSIDPTRVFERLCADVACALWGGKDRRAKALVVGSARQQNLAFREIIDQLCDDLGEGGGWRPEAHSPGAGDGGLDVVVWRRFSDDRSGALVGFGQCKTGDHWNQHLGKHRPRNISRRFLRSPLIVDPLPLYFVPCRIDASEWNDATGQHEGLLLDRCRITEFGGEIAPDTLRQCRTWLKAALDQERRPAGMRSRP